MGKPLFRRQSLERVSSPEELHDYMRVTSPKTWMLLSVIIVLMAGFIFYACTTSLETVIDVQIEIRTYELPEEYFEEEGRVYVSGSLPISMMDTINVGMKVRLLNQEGWVSYITTSYSDDYPSEEVLMPDEIYYNVEVSKDFKYPGDGVYDAQIILDSATPISYLLG